MSAAPSIGQAPAAAIVHQDRPEHLDGLRLAVASLRLRCPALPVLVSAPNAPEELTAWLCKAGAETFAVGSALTASGWNVKPLLLLEALELGYSTVLWLDADVIVSRDPHPVLPQDQHVLVAAEEFALAQEQGSGPRTSAWGLPRGRSLRCTVNSGVMRVSARHASVLRDWAALLDREDYRVAQQLPALERPLHMVGDQDALTALLGSAAHADVPLQLLRRGIEIAQCAGPAGFTPGERLRSLAHGTPTFIHSVGVKPWQHGAGWRYAGNRMSRLRASYEDAHIRVSPYTIAAREISSVAGVRCERFAPRSLLERLLLTFGRLWPALPELPLALFDKAVRSVRSSLRIGRFAAGA